MNIKKVWLILSSVWIALWSYLYVPVLLEEVESFESSVSEQFRSDVLLNFKKCLLDNGTDYLSVKLDSVTYCKDYVAKQCGNVLFCSKDLFRELCFKSYIEPCRHFAFVDPNKMDGVDRSLKRKAGLFIEKGYYLAFLFYIAFVVIIPYLMSLAPKIKKWLYT
ncbi:hypothetical protein [Photobacterium iliopiscarium]|uniref:hypothetical protein n=1 Tax=Photobacterium iliopiscarium TaxID=56192 RepID=UPI000D16B962|nr:hypothetical protein [Photobacterium iliopiscarium]PSU01682.1 hypothetical protein C9I85_00445 [Photobacterium iliopiscarium]PSV83432.1 hypothetical protein C9J51_09050 [Photobacterium iliopiscarium]